MSVVYWLMHIKDMGVPDRVPETRKSTLKSCKQRGVEGYET